MSAKLSREDVLAAKLRNPMCWDPEIELEHRKDGSIIVQQVGHNEPAPQRIFDQLLKWVNADPDVVALADRGPDGEWRKLTYGSMFASAQSLGQALIDLNLSPEHPLLILSGNDLEHAQLALACELVGIPYAPVSEAYSLVSTDHSKLKDIVALLEPGLVFASDGEKFSAALKGAIPASIPVLVSANPSADNQLKFDDLLHTRATDEVEKARLKVGPETIAKFLFTSGSTGSPKAVINTHGMICANQMMIRDCYAFLKSERPIVLDWAPWNHTAGGNKVFFMTLFNGGTLYIDDGRPTPAAMEKTVRNLTEVAPTWYFNVPRGYEELVHAFDNNHELRDNFFSRVKMLMYAGAGIAQHTWNDLQRQSVESSGERILICSGLGATETSPFSLMCTIEAERAGNVGIPSKEITLKLVPVGDKLEARIKGPNVTPGYWKNPDLTARAFDEEGFYNFGDALKFADEADPLKGFYFDGRTAENFKLRTGTWVAVGRLRAHVIDQFEGLVRDVALTGLDQEFIGGLIFPQMRDVQALVPEFQGTDAELLNHPKVRETFAKKLNDLAKTSTGSSTLVRRILLLSDPPEIDKGEVTDKGSINQRAVLSNRSSEAVEIYSQSDRVISIGG